MFSARSDCWECAGRSVFRTMLCAITAASLWRSGKGRVQQVQQALVQNNHFSEGPNPSFFLVVAIVIDSLLFQGNHCSGAAQSAYSAAGVPRCRARERERKRRRFRRRARPWRSSAWTCSSARTRFDPANVRLAVSGGHSSGSWPRARHCHFEPGHRYFCDFNWRAGSRQ